MTLEEKKAIQTIIIDEIAQQSQAAPTLLIDALLTGQGYQFVHHVLSRRLGMATQLSQMTTHLLKAMSGDQQVRTDAEDAA